MSDDRDTERPEAERTLSPPPPPPSVDEPFPALPRTMPSPPFPVSQESELILKSMFELKGLVTLLGNTTMDLSQRVERIETKVESVLRQVEGAKEASESAIDIATEAKAEVRRSVPPTRTLRAICEHAEEEAAIAMDVGTRVAERFGVLDIVEEVKQEHAASRSEKTRASIGPAGR